MLTLRLRPGRTTAGDGPLIHQSASMQAGVSDKVHKHAALQACKPCTGTLAALVSPRDRHIGIMVR
jgi:hypothetical protein